MKSADYLREVAKTDPLEPGGIVVNRNRYQIVTTRRDGRWLVAVARTIRYEYRVITAFFDHEEEAWECLLKAYHPRLLKKWKLREAEAEND